MGSVLRSPSWRLVLVAALLEPQMEILSPAVVCTHTAGAVLIAAGDQTWWPELAHKRVLREMEHSPPLTDAIEPR